VILEGIVTTLDEDAAVRVTPMGPTVEEDFQRLIFRPFKTSRTFRNLKRTGQGVFHVTDDVELIAHAAVDQLTTLPRLVAAQLVDGFILADACRWYAFRVESVQDESPRATISCRVVESATEREFFGFNRAKHAVVEAAILATRVQIMDVRELRDELRRLAPLVQKTGGPAERRAFAFLKDFMLSDAADSAQG
jgi:hypothetical protein